MAKVKGDVSDVIESATKPARYMMKKLSSAFPLPDAGILKSRGDGDARAIAKRKAAVARKMNTEKIRPGGPLKGTRNPELDRKQGNR